MWGTELRFEGEYGAHCLAEDVWGLAGVAEDTGSAGERLIWQVASAWDWAWRQEAWQGGTELCGHQRTRQGVLGMTKWSSKLSSLAAPPALS